MSGYQYAERRSRGETAAFILFGSEVGTRSDSQMAMLFSNSRNDNRIQPQFGTVAFDHGIAFRSVAY
jgi:hypothetical protein